MKTKYIHVNQHKIRSNKKNGTNEAVITIKEGSKNTYCQVGTQRDMIFHTQLVEYKKC